MLQNHFSHQGKQVSVASLYPGGLHFTVSLNLIIGNSFVFHRDKLPQNFSRSGLFMDQFTFCKS